MISVGSNVAKRNGRLVIRSGWLGSAIALGAFRTTASFDPGDRKIRVTKRQFWLPKRRRIGFDMVEAITYGYDDIAPFAGWSWGHNAVDVFTVGLRFFDGEELTLGRFAGPGSFVNDSPMPDWIFWDDFAFDFVGSQESRAKAVVDLLSAMLGVTVQPPS